MAEIAFFAGKEFFLGRVVEIDPVAVGKVKLEVAQGIGRARPLTNIHLRTAGSTGE